MLNNSESLTDLIAALASETISVSSLAERSLERASQNEHLNAFAALDEPIVMSQAKAATLRRQNGKPLSPIDGIPIAVKDNYLTLDYPTTACSDAAPREPSGIDATIVANLRAAGAIIFGKTNMHEWAYGATNNTSNIGPTHNPHNQAHITGGSSGGSGAAVAAGIVSAALGSDTGGSVRIPSAACGIYGYKPSYGRASRYGVLPLSWSLDAPGPMTISMDDIFHLLPYFLRSDAKDVTTSGASAVRNVCPVSEPRFVALFGEGLERAEEVDAAVTQAMRKLPGRVEEASIKNVQLFFSCWETILHCEASSYHSELLARNPACYSPMTRAHLETGKLLTGVELLEAYKIRGNFLRLLLEELPPWDVLLLPTLPVPAPVHGEPWQEFGGRRVTTQDSMTWFCWLGNLAGLPCLTIPIAKSDKGLPIGLMLMGRPGRDEELLAIGKIVDQHINGHR